MVSVSRTLLRNLVNFGPFGHAEDLSKQLKVPWEIKGTLKSITIKTREWRGHTIVQGFQAHTVEGSARACGMNFNDIRDTITFVIPEDRYIFQVHIAAASYIHSLGFVLDNGEVLGPVGGERAVSAGKPIKTVVIPSLLGNGEENGSAGTEGGEKSGKTIETYVITPNPLIQQQSQQQQQQQLSKTSTLCGISGISVHSEKAPAIAQVVFTFASE